MFSRLYVTYNHKLLYYFLRCVSLINIALDRPSLLILSELQLLILKDIKQYSFLSMLSGQLSQIQKTIQQFLILILRRRIYLIELFILHFPRDKILHHSIAQFEPTLNDILLKKTLAHYISLEVNIYPHSKCKSFHVGIKRTYLDQVSIQHMICFIRKVD